MIICILISNHLVRRLENLRGDIKQSIRYYFSELKGQAGYLSTDLLSMILRVCRIEPYDQALHGSAI